MKEKASTSFALSQIEEALEERQKPDRRNLDVGLDPKSKADRRKLDRRHAKKLTRH